MLFKDIKVGETYKVESLGKIVNVLVTAKSKDNNIRRVEYEYPEMNIFGCTKGWQFGNGSDFPNIMPL